MKSSPKPVRATQAQGGKALVTAAAFAATLVGWATLTAQTPPEAVAQAPAPSSMAIAEPPAWLLSAPSIPALPAVATVQIIPIRMAAAAPQAAEVATATLPPIMASAPVAPLREVAAAPAPVPVRIAPRVIARTRTSR